jgi:anti-sigma B factor antagonist
LTTILLVDRKTHKSRFLFCTRRPTDQAILVSEAPAGSTFDIDILCGDRMDLRREQLADGIEKISLVGRMDSIGGHDIDNRFKAMVGSRKLLAVVDMSEVSFLASIGIRTLVINARAQSSRGGGMVLASPQPLVAEVLKMAGIDTIIPVYPDVDSAFSALMASSESR